MMKRDQIFVDIIMPNYNKEEFIEEAIKSVLNQSYKYWKLYIIDDNSRDKSKKILKKFRKNKKIKIIFLKKNKGPATCRNIGISLSKSYYLSFLDSDDYWPKNKLSSQINFMNVNNVKFSYTDYMSFHKNNKNFLKRTNVPSIFNLKSFSRNSSINTSTMILRRNIIKKIKFRNIKKHEDYIFKCEVFKKNKNLFAKKFNKTHAYYRILKNSRSRNKLKSIYYLWKYNNEINKFSFIDNMLSILSISINSIKKYGFRMGV